MNVSMMKPDQSVKLKVFRNGDIREVTVQLAPLPGQPVERAGLQKDHSAEALQGVSVQDLDAQTARQLGLPASTKGAVVTNVDPSSPAATAGLQEGDVIQQANRQPVANSDDLAQALKKSNGESLLLVNRGGNKVFLAV